MTEAIRLNAHDYLVRVLARWLERNDYSVAAALEDHTKPPLINGYRPDVFATQGGSQVIGEAEVCENVHDAETEARWREFFVATFQSGSDTRQELHIIVQSKCLDEAKQRATAWGIRATFHTEKLANQPGLSGGQ